MTFASWKLCQKVSVCPVCGQREICLSFHLDKRHRSSRCLSCARWLMDRIDELMTKEGLGRTEAEWQAKNEQTIAYRHPTGTPWHTS